MAVTGCLSILNAGLNAGVRHAARVFSHARRLAGHHASRHVHWAAPASPRPGLSPACRDTDAPYRAMHRALHPAGDAARAPAGSGAVAKAAGGAALAAAAVGAGAGYHAFGAQGGGAAPGVGTGSSAWPDLTGAQIGLPGTLPAFATAGPELPGPELPGAVQAIPLMLASPASAFEAAAPASVPEASSVLILASGLLAVTLLKASARVVRRAVNPEA